MSSYRVTVKVRNANLLRAIEDSGYSPGSKFSDLVGVPYQYLNDIINMKKSPVDKNGDLLPYTEKLCVFLNKMPSELFDFDQMHNTIESNSHDFETDYDGIKCLINSVSSPMIKNAIDAALDSLTDTEAETLRLRFGIDTNEHTLDSIAKIRGVTQERVRQIEAKALRKLRHFTRSGKLKDAIDDDLIMR